MDYATKADIERILDKVNEVPQMRRDVSALVEDVVAMRTQMKFITAILGAFGLSGLGLLTTYIAKHAF